MAARNVLAVLLEDGRQSRLRQAIAERGYGVPNLRARTDHAAENPGPGSPPSVCEAFGSGVAFVEASSRVNEALTSKSKEVPMSTLEPDPEREGPAPEPEPEPEPEPGQPDTMPEEEPGITAPEPDMLPEEPDVAPPEPERERT